MERLSLVEKLGQGLESTACVPAKDRIACHSSLLALGTKFCNYCCTTLPPASSLLPRQFLSCQPAEAGLVLHLQPTLLLLLSLLCLWGMWDWPQPISSALPQVIPAQHWALWITAAWKGWVGINQTELPVRGFGWMCTHTHTHKHPHIYNVSPAQPGHSKARALPAGEMQKTASLSFPFGSLCTEL